MEKRGMVTAVDRIEDWIEMRSKLLRQLKVLEAGEMYRGDKIFGCHYDRDGCPPQKMRQ
jgi:hypothetical protein